MNTNSSNGWFRQNLTKIAAALIVFLDGADASTGSSAIEPSRIPAIADVTRLKQA